MKSKQKTVTTTYRLTSHKLPSCRIAFVSDLHERDGSQALEILHREQPDLILLGGDILERCSPGESEYTQRAMNEWQGFVNDGSLKYKLIRFLLHAGDLLHVRDQSFHGGMDFLRKAAGIAPVYYSSGNHEWYYYPEDLAEFQAAGITLLNNQDVSVSLKKILLCTQKEPVCRSAADTAACFHIGGLPTRYDREWLTQFSQKPGGKILICHHPEYYKRFIHGTERDTFDLIFSGHVHGGQWRIGKRGVLAPGQGLFPEYGYGLHHNKLVIGAGLANTATVPRWGNPMEVVIVEILSPKTDTGSQ